MSRSNSNKNIAMFRKLVSNLPFSPALVGQLGFYARRLRKEEMSRRLGLLMTVMALIVQSLTVFIPSTSANSSNASDLISGGVSSLSQVLSTYDSSSSDYKKILDYVGITRAEIASAKKTTINSKDYGTGAGAWLSWGRVSHYSAAQGEVKHDINGTIIYSRPLWRADSTSWTIPHGSMYNAFVGTSAKIGKFAIIMGCGNVVTLKIPPVVKKISVCRPGVGVISINENEKLSTDLDASSDHCKPKISVCRPGVGVISIYESERQATDVDANSDTCKPKTPTASCLDLLDPIKIDRTHYNFKAKAAADSGATVSAYVFTIHKNDKNGTVVTTKTVNSTALEAESGSIELKDAGNYYVTVTVKTSLGDKQSDSCAGTVTVTPPEVCDLNHDILKSDPDCKPCPGNHDIWYKSPECNEVILESKTATNLTQQADATKVTANAGDRIKYEITVSNPGKVAATANFDDELGDILEYATIQDNGGGTYNPDKKTLSWANVQLVAGTKQTRTFVVALPATIPTTARGASDPTSYDCIMNNTFGNNIQVNVTCEAPKVVEQTIKQLPSTGPTENMLFAGALIAVVTFFWARSRQLGKEVRLVRREFSASTI